MSKNANQLLRSLKNRCRRGAASCLAVLADGGGAGMPRIMEVDADAAGGRRGQPSSNSGSPQLYR